MQVCNSRVISAGGHISEHLILTDITLISDASLSGCGKGQREEKNVREHHSGQGLNTKVPAN